MSGHNSAVLKTVQMYEVLLGKLCVYCFQVDFPFKTVSFHCIPVSLFFKASTDDICMKSFYHTAITLRLIILKYCKC